MVARALLVGINCYPGIGNLEGPENDVAAMEEWLTSPAGGSLDPNQDIQKITSGIANPDGLPKTAAKARPIMSQIYDWVDALVEEGTSHTGAFPLGDRLYLFFAGHGYHSTGNTAVFMANAWVNNLGEALPMQPLAEYLRSYAFFREVILIADTCREQIDFAPNPYFTRKAQVSPNAGSVLRFDAYPCPVGIKTKEVSFNGKSGGVLTNAFLTGVAGLAARGGIVRSDYLKSYMINAVEQRLTKSPEIICSEEANAFQIASAPDQTTRLTVSLAAGATAGLATLVDGASNTVVATQDLAAGPLVKDVPPGFFTLMRNGSADRTIRVAWETTNVEY